MPAVAAKVVTIITGEQAQERVWEALPALGAPHFSYCAVRGQGVHGKIAGGLFEDHNLAITIVTTDAVATRIVQWLERDLMPTFPAIAYITDSVALLSATP
jgi:hypothetical protein